MPNWCANGVTIRHCDPSKINELVKAMEKGEFFDAVIPVPQELKDPGTSTYGGDDAELYEEIRRKNVEKYGYGNWYDFCVERWGTKWDVTCENIDVDDGGREVRLSFDSAWAPPIGVYEALVDEGYEVTAYYYESGMAFVGKWDNGRDDYNEISGESSATVREAIGEELDDYFAISENMAMWEEEENE